MPTEVPRPGHQLATVPTRAAAAWYWLRVRRQIALRAARELFGGRARRYGASAGLETAPLLAESRSPLWDEAGGDEFTLVAGKVHNLRIAARAFDGVVVPAGATFSFWKQLGRPSARRGFVLGREIREGCVVPTIAGGLCQLSNALARAADAAGFELIERWGHTARPVNASSPPDEAIDATVLWNYVDLRIRAATAFRLEVELDASELRVTVRSLGPGPAARAGPLAPAYSQPLPRPTFRLAQAPPPPARGCLSCDETSCFRHAARPPPLRGATAVLVDAWTPEFARWLSLAGLAGDWFVPWLRPARRAGGHWQPALDAVVHIAVRASLRRMLALRRAAGEGGARQAALLAGQAGLAQAYAARLRPEHTHLVIDQALLLPLFELGALGGRTYDVLAAALPAAEVQARLDAAARAWPGAASLIDFRIDDASRPREALAWFRARRIVTAHRDVHRHFTTLGLQNLELLDWVLPAAGPAAVKPPSAPPVVGFAASALARKGVHEMAAALRELGWPVVVFGTPSADPRLWHGIDVRQGSYAARWLAEVDLVALPAHVEHAPRALLHAFAQGLPIVATLACGLGESAGVFTVDAGDVPGLVAALREAAASRFPRRPIASGNSPMTLSDPSGGGPARVSE